MLFTSPFPFRALILIDFGNWLTFRQRLLRYTRSWRRRYLSISLVLWWFVVGCLGFCYRMSREGVRRFDLYGLYTVRWDAGCCVFLKDGGSELGMDVYLILSFRSVYFWFNFNHWFVEAEADILDYNGQQVPWPRLVVDSILPWIFLVGPPVTNIFLGYLNFISIN